MASMRPDAGPSEAELQQMLAEMREAPAEQVLVEVINLLLQAAQVKLGRPDARLLIDAVASVADSAAGRADANLLAQVTQAVTQLRMAQVEAEGSTVANTDPGPGAPTASAVPAPPAAAPDARPGGPARPPAQGSRLWVPGR